MPILDDPGETFAINCPLPVNGLTVSCGYRHNLNSTTWNFCSVEALVTAAGITELLATTPTTPNMANNSLQLEYLSVTNTDLVPVQFQFGKIGDAHLPGFVPLYSPTLLDAGETLIFNLHSGWQIYDALGLMKVESEGLVGPTGPVGPPGPVGPTGPQGPAQFPTLVIEYPVTTGFAYTAPDSAEPEIVFALIPGGTLASGSLTMPAAPQPNQKVSITSTQKVTAFTVFANAGQGIFGAPVGTALAANSAMTWIYGNAIFPQWYRLS